MIYVSFHPSSDLPISTVLESTQGNSTSVGESDTLPSNQEPPRKRSNRDPRLKQVKFLKKRLVD